jgi:hypothetical protein
MLFSLGKVLISPNTTDAYSRNAEQKIYSFAASDLSIISGGLRWMDHP